MSAIPSREILLRDLSLEMPGNEDGKREVIVRLANQVLDDLQLVHLLEIIKEVKREPL